MLDQHRLFFFLLIASFGEKAASQCGPGWTFLPATGHCYHMVPAPIKTSWVNAESTCQSLGGHITSIENHAEWIQVSGYFRARWANTWLGGYLDSARLKWQSVEGEGFPNYNSFVPWCITHPRWNIPGKRCIALGEIGGNICLFDLNCQSEAAAQIVCRAPPSIFQPKQSPRIAAKCKEGFSFFPQTGFCYGADKENPMSITWENAENRCQALGGHLAVIQNYAEYQHILSYFHARWRNTWLGYRTDNFVTYFKVEDGSPFTPDFLRYNRWCRTHPWKHVPGRRCIGLGYEGDVCFFDQNCSTELSMQMLCKIPPEKEITPEEVTFEDPKLPEIPKHDEAPVTPKVDLPAIETTRQPPRTCRI